MIRTQQDKILWEIIRKGSEIDLSDLRRIIPRVNNDGTRRNYVYHLIDRGLVLKRIIRINPLIRGRPTLAKYRVNPDLAYKIKRIFKEELEKTSYRVPESEKSLNKEKSKFGEILPHGIKQY